VEDGWLPVFSVSTMEEAADLLVLACETNVMGEFVARELAVEQTLENLEAFSTRLDQAHDVLVAHDRCSCRAPTVLELCRRAERLSARAKALGAKVEVLGAVGRSKHRGGHQARRRKKARSG
jgi:hypothetical protein